MANNRTYNDFYPTALTIAGSDSGGGAGIQADLRTFIAYGVYGCSAITALTAQNPLTMAEVMPATPQMVAAQIKAVTDKIAVKAVKTGMLFSSAIIEQTANVLNDINLPVVVDPVIVSTSGARLLEEDAITLLKEKLLPVTTWITPNVPEAELLLDMKIIDRKSMLEAARLFFDKWNCHCVIKAGHLLEGLDVAADIICYNGDLYELSSPKMTLKQTTSHGGGCTFSAAMAAGIALNFDWQKTLLTAKEFVFGSLAECVLIGNKLEAMYPPHDSYKEKTMLIPIV